MSSPNRCGGLPWIVVGLLTVGVSGWVTTASAQHEPAATQPAAAGDPTTRAATQPTTTQAAADEKREAQIVRELAEEEAQRAQAKLEQVKETIEEREEGVLDALPPAVAERERRGDELAQALAEREIALNELRKTSAQRLQAVADHKLAIAELSAGIQAQLDQIEALEPTKRSKLAAEYETMAAQRREAAEAWRETAQDSGAAINDLQKLQQGLRQQLDELAAGDPLRKQVRDALGQIELLLLYHRQISSFYDRQANAEHRLAWEYEQATEQMRAYNRRFFERHAKVFNVAWLLVVTLAATYAVNLLSWLINRMLSFVFRRRRGAATPAMKRAQTLIQFARSIVKLLLWLVVLVLALAEFGVSPGNSAGALGVIGLVLAGMFNQLVVDFVKGIDIAIGGHYFVGDFVQLGGHSGHVLDFTVKYTVLRTPSGQVITLPNSQCIPAQRFPSGYVDNYVDLSVTGDVDRAALRRELDEIGRGLNERIEAVKLRPEEVGEFRQVDRRVVRVRVRVLPTCDWVVRDYYIPMVKERCGEVGITLADEPTVIHLNDVATFRRLFSRQMTDREIAATLAAESRPTMEREELVDPEVATVPAKEDQRVGSS